MSTPHLFASVRSASSALNASRNVSRSTRFLHLRSTAPLQQQSNKENLMDRESMNPTSTEYSKSGGGDDAAAHTSEAFNPKNTDPDAETRKGGSKSGDESDNPLNVSPGNSEANPRGKEQSQSSQGAAGNKASQRQSPDKKG